ncbi:MAG: hypothetical protein IJY30_01615, partial [Muribaculaceae bacterium]|nr:hypothetical protein [Muribaculaceae bacterium]
TTSACSPNANCIIAEVTGDYAANLYQYVPGQLATMYTFRVDDGTGIENIAVNDTISICQIGDNIKISGIEAKSIVLYSVNGAAVCKALNSNELQTAGLRGLYIVLITEHSGMTYTKKLVIK